MENKVLQINRDVLAIRNVLTDFLQRDIIGKEEAATFGAFETVSRGDVGKLIIFFKNGLIKFYFEHAGAYAVIQQTGILGTDFLCMDRKIRITDEHYLSLMTPFHREEEKNKFYLTTCFSFFLKLASSIFCAWNTTLSFGS